MTREDQIRNEAIDFSEYEDNFLEYDDCGDICDDKLFIENAFISGAKWADKTMIEKACKWLEDNLFDHSPDKEAIDIEWDTSIISNLIVCDYFNSIDECINDFKKAMEE